MNLSIRLAKIAEFVPQDAVIADVGTDHGHLPVWLVQQGRCDKALAMDVGKGPLSRAAQLVKSCGLEEQITLRLSDGVAALKPGEADVVVIAGMGGPLIRKIMAEGTHMWSTVRHWIISPQSELGQTRHWLEEQGFAIAGEEIVFDTGKYYYVIDVVPGKMHYERESDYEYGESLIRQGHPILKEYLAHQQKMLLDLKAGIGKNLEKQDSEGGRNRLKEVETQLEILKDAQARLGCGA